MYYMSFDKIVEIFDTIFDYEGFDYKKAKNTYKRLKAILYSDRELRKDKDLQPLFLKPSFYYKTFILPTQKDVEHAFKLMNEDEAYRNRVEKLLTNDKIVSRLIQFSEAIAFITKAITTDKDKKSLIYATGLSAELFNYEDLDILNADKNERKSKAKTLGMLLSAIEYHENFGHGKLKHLEIDFIKDNPLVSNVLTDLVINTRIEKILPNSFNVLKEKIPGGIYRTSYMHPALAEELVVMDAMLNPEKIKNIPDDKKNELKDKVKVPETFIKFLDKNRLFNFLNNDAQEVFEEYKESLKTEPNKAVENYIKTLDKLLELYVRNSDFNVYALDNFVYAYDKLRDIYRMPESKYIIAAQEEKNDFKNFINTAFMNILGFIDGYTPIYDEKNSKDEGEKTDKDKGEGKQTPQKQNSPFESDIDLTENGLKDDPDDPFFDEIDDKEAKKRERELESAEKEYENKINKELNISGKSVGKDEGNIKVELKKVNFTIEDLKKILSSLISKYVLPSKIRTPERKSSVIKTTNIDIMRQQVLEGRKDLALPLGTPGKIYLKSNNDALLFSIVDVSGSMSQNVIGAYKSALVNHCITDSGTVVFNIDNDTRYKGIKVMNSDLARDSKAVKDFVSYTGMGGTEGFGDYILMLLGKEDSKDIYNKNNEKFIEDFKRLYKENFNENFDVNKFIEKIKKGDFKVSILTDEGITYTNLFSNDLINTLNELGINEPLFHIFTNTENEYDYIKKYIDKNKIQHLYKVYKIPNIK